jgi:3-oxoacyl-[acyl-carrier protein] reductase
MKLKDRVAIVTGGAMGIGRAIALALAKEGADVVVADIAMKEANEVVKEIKALGRKAIAVRADVANVEETKQIAQAALKEFGKIDILVNNAGVAVGGLFHTSEKEAWQRGLDLTIGGVYNCTRTVINHMIERRSGKILNIGSAAGIIGKPGATSYSAGKAGIVGFTMALAKEVVTYGINVNCLSPGPISTRAGSEADRRPEEVKRRLIESTGFGRRGTPEEIAGPAVFLVSDDASFITGQNLNVGGLRTLGLD